MSQPLKILVCGDVNGKINQLYNRVKTVLKKNPGFEMLLCVGSFFSGSEETHREWDSYMKGELRAPIITYILGPNDPEEMKYFEADFLEDGTELCENITYLGRKGVLKTPSGLQIAYLSGTDKAEGLKGGCVFSEQDVASLESKSNEENFKGVDLLLTSCWPQDVAKFTKKPSDVETIPPGSTTVSQLASKLKPRYHFVGKEGIHFERVPYRNHQVLREPARHVTRFIALSYIGNPQKKKYMYAFNIVPMSAMDASKLTEQPDDVTENPYGKQVSNAQSQPVQKPASGGFFFDMSKAAGQGQKRRGPGDGNPPKQPRKGPPPTKGPCWFCLGSPNVEKHLVVSVGNMTYVALAKGGLVPEHVLVCPIAHFESTVKLDEETLMELEKYKQALKKMFKKKGRSCVMFERNFYTQHLQLQVIPIPKIPEDEVKEAFRGHAEMKGMEMTDLASGTDLKQAVRIGAPYFVVEFESGDRMLHRVRGKMDLQFGREVVACDSLLNMPERIDWRECKVSEMQEKDMVATFRKDFAPFDFN
ncbi:CWF19-like protein 1 isoform X2 [Nematostella vectensis]|uniref:CWF19-like protein 1 isoform X2 n=1 Tax=Nematostella vectensis TaxID=45351 RepID=UPI00207722B8|nr:CWF19-like protein 1 isoform X2 [Nematostella vectensis]